MNIAIICQWFPPEYAPIGVMLQELAEDLSNKGHALTVITGFPNHPAGELYEGYKRSLFAEEKLGKIRIIRCYLYVSSKKTFLRRALSILSFAVTSFLAAVRLERQDIFFMVSPPLSNGVVALILKKFKNFKFIFNIQDIYPDAAVSTAVIKNRLLIRSLEMIERKIYDLADKITVIADGFMENLIGKGVAVSKIHVIRNWVDTNKIVPMDKDNDFSRQYGFSDKFVVLYSGTIGLISGAEILLDCAEQLSSIDEMLFLFVGEGVVKEIIMENAGKKKLKNVMLLPFQPREILSKVQSSSDVSVVTLRRGNGRMSVPSKVLGYMAAARPIVASLDPGSDMEKLIREAGCGICVDAGDANGLSKAILQMYYDRCKAEKLGRNGREFLEKYCERRVVTAQYEKLFASVIVDRF